MTPLLWRQNSTLIDFIRSEVRDAVIFFRPCPATIRALVESAPAAGALALLCAHDSLAELRELIRQTEIEAGPQSLVFFHGGITKSLRVFPLRWRLALITGPADEISASEVGELANSLASNAMLVWYGPDLKAEGLLDNLIATGTARPDENRSTDFRVLRTRNRLPHLRASARPADWSILRTLLIERDFRNAVPSAGPKLADVLRSLRLRSTLDLLEVGLGSRSQEVLGLSRRGASLAIDARNASGGGRSVDGSSGLCYSAHDGCGGRIQARCLAGGRRTTYQKHSGADQGLRVAAK